MAMDEQFYTSDVTRITGVKRNRLQVWLDRGWIIPSIKKAQGQGSRNIFGLHDLYVIALFKKLVGIGVPRKFVGMCTQAFFKQPLLGLFLRADNYCWFEVYRTGEGEFESELVFRPELGKRDRLDCYDMVAINIAKFAREIDLKIEQEIK
jgi:DNA-binding transcriptional MerR regulator